ncbi:MAG: AraC family transcriptional regulator [Bacteroidota bacterium]
MKPRNSTSDKGVSGLVSLQQRGSIQCVDWQEEGLNSDALLPHNHAYDEILFFSSGDGTYLLEETTYPITQSSVLFIRKGQRHAVRPNRYLIGGHIIFDVDDLITDRDLPFKSFFYDHDSSLPRIDLKKEVYKEIWSIFLQIKELLSAQNKTYLKEYSLTYFNLLLLKLADALSVQGKPIDKPQTFTPAQRFKNLVASQYQTMRSVEEYAKQLHICSKYLHELCKKAYGRSPSQIINQYLTDEIRRRLIHSNQSLKEIAYQLQFNDQAYFNRFFKKMTGMAPGYFRRKSKN